MKMLTLPIPMIVAVVMPQIDKPEAGMTPGTAGSLILGTVFLLLWFLNAIGKLPGNGSDRRTHAYTSADRAQMTKLTDLLAERIGEDGLERYLIQAQQTREIHESMVSVAKNMEDMSRFMGVLAKDAERRA